jgi:hypothetical protein
VWRDVTRVEVPPDLHRDRVPGAGSPLECYQQALFYLLDHSDHEVQLVHGLVQERGRLWPHAWAEIGGQAVYDPTPGEFYDRDSFYAVLTPTVVRMFTPEQAAALPPAGRAVAVSSTQASGPRDGHRPEGHLTGTRAKEMVMGRPATAALTTAERLAKISAETAAMTRKEPGKIAKAVGGATKAAIIAAPPAVAAGRTATPDQFDRSSSGVRKYRAWVLRSASSEAAPSSMTSISGRPCSCRSRANRAVSAHSRSESGNRRSSRSCPRARS